MYSASHILGFVSICLFAQAQLTQMPDVNAPEERRPPPWEPPGRVYFTKDQVLRAVERAKERLKARKEEEFLRWSENGRTDPPSPHGAMAALFNKPTPDALERANVSHLYEMASEELFRISTNRVRRQLGGDLIDFGPNSVFEDNSLNNNFGQFQNSDIIEVIPPPPSLQKCGLTEPSVCDPTSPFRTFSGVCNNLARPNLGRSLTPYTRLLPAAYQDRVSVPRVTGISGRPLPSPRIISTLVHRDVSHLSSRFSLMLMQFGQFLDHDISFTPNHRSFSASIPDCASCDSSRHPECMPIPVPINDPFHPPPNNGRPKCFAFIRSLPGQLNFGPREQVNQNSAFIDASQVYGEHICRTTSLRAPGGRMNATFFPPMGPNSRARELLPQVTSNCRGTCFAAGDGRASEQPGLTIMHTIFMREHNRLADALHQINPRWSEETVFHQARKIVAAQVQHIAFSEFLPRILGPDNVAKNNLGLLSDGYYNGYNASCDPRVYNEFVAAAFRFGHSLVRPHLPRVGARWEPLTPPLLLRENFFDSSSLMNPRMMDELIRGLLASPTEDADRFISGEVTNHLFEARRNPFSGLDIAALNIQRGRDHGLQSYNEYRAMCGLKKAIVWDDLLGEMTVEAAETLRGVYGNVDDVDLYPGGASESALPGALVGPTFSCIIAMQFRKFRDCDRFWYETGSQVERFSPAQLAELRKTSLSKIICNNMDVPIDIQLAAFDLPNGSTNPRVDCKTLNGIDLNAWREFGVQGRALNSGPGSFCQFNERVVRIGESQLVLPCTSCQCTITGMRCKSIRVTDCSALISRVGLAAMRRDVVCMAQCRRILSNEPSGPPGPPLATAPLLGRPPGPPGPPAPEEGGILNNLSLKGMRPLFNRLLGFLG
ncbi:heme peroxidase 2-like [Cloeon dipterum]|uniref:heme peroxidase 2-like n=1 Tax=Cloeon dipterum TaxID=197152 RepID=UPI0032201A74